MPLRILQFRVRLRRGTNASISAAGFCSCHRERNSRSPSTRFARSEQARDSQDDSLANRPAPLGMTIQRRFESARPSTSLRAGTVCGMQLGRRTPSLRSGFRRAAQTPRRRLNFDLAQDKPQRRALIRIEEDHPPLLASSRLQVTIGGIDICVDRHFQVSPRILFPQHSCIWMNLLASNKFAALGNLFRVQIQFTFN